MPPSNPSLCMVPKCSKPPAVNCRGLCMKCYSSAKKRVDSGETNWDELADMGLCEQQDDAFTTAYKNKRRES